ncbi:MAG: DUF2007 domain-containing protein [Rhodospirillales bacterium]|nr:DUF2007 domain-containing protein [Alphaproteobacteria bacterium]MBL6947259.1 DUF2007 domain-containing protein [Rhodospirillales bacterium]
MEELVRSNDPVFLSWLTARLQGEEIDAVVLDTHTSVMEGSISAIPRRVMIETRDLWRAKKILAEAYEIQAGNGQEGEPLG